MKKILCKTALVIIPICCFISLFLACGNRQDISGTIIAKSGEIQSKYKSTKNINPQKRQTEKRSRSLVSGNQTERQTERHSGL